MSPLSPPCVPRAQVQAVAASRPDPTVCISGRSGEGLPGLLSLIASKLSSGLREIEVLLPHTRGDIVEQVGAMIDMRCDGSKPLWGQ